MTTPIRRKYGTSLTPEWEGGGHSPFSGAIEPLVWMEEEEQYRLSRVSWLSVTKKRLIALLSGLVDTFTLCIVNSNSHSFCTTSGENGLSKIKQIGQQSDIADTKRGGNYGSFAINKGRLPTIEKASAIWRANLKEQHFAGWHRWNQRGCKLCFNRWAHLFYSSLQKRPLHWPPYSRYYPQDYKTPLPICWKICNKKKQSRHSLQRYCQLIALHGSLVHHLTKASPSFWCTVSITSSERLVGLFTLHLGKHNSKNFEHYIFPIVVRASSSSHVYM